MSPGSDWVWRDGWARLAAWEKAFGVVARVSGRTRGDMKDPLCFNRALTALGLPADGWAGGTQVHGARTRRVRGPSAPKEWPATDGLWTDRPGVALRVFTADCVPVFLLDPRGRRIGLLHAGWRGAADNILGRALNRFRRRGRWRMALGPHVRACCYAVSDDVAHRFRRVPGAVTPARAGENPRLHLDRVLIHAARAAGLRRVAAAPWCTACDGRFFSFRRTATPRRQAALLALRGDTST